MATPDTIFTSTARVLDVVLPALRRGAGPISDQAAYAAMRRTLATLAADTRAAARSTTLAADLAGVVVGLRTSSSDPRAVIVTLERLLVSVRSFQPVAPRTNTLALEAQHETALLMMVETVALSQIAAAVSSLTLRSRDEAEGYRLRLGRAFDVAIERASETRFVDLLRVLRETQAALSRDLIERGRPLARIVNYATGVPLPAVVLAHALYQDAGRAGELVGENPAQHPSFMPTAGRAYSR